MSGAHAQSVRWHTPADHHLTDVHAVQGLEAVQAVLCDEGAGGRPWGAGGVAQSPGKRKRSRKRWCLRGLAQIPLQDEVSCIHLLPYPQGKHDLTFTQSSLHHSIVVLILGFLFFLRTCQVSGHQ